LRDHFRLVERWFHEMNVVPVERFRSFRPASARAHRRHPECLTCTCARAYKR